MKAAAMFPERIGPYAIEKRIGAGGMGNVYLGRHAESGLLAAIKELPAFLAREEGFVQRFEREVQSLEKLKSQHIVQLYDSGEVDDTYYYAMEYVEGETLAALIRREKRIPWRRAVEIGIQVCSALKTAHDAGIIHRDLKPSNLMIRNDGAVKLTDFGVAQFFAASKLTVTGGVIGTAEYMSPEQAQGVKATRRSDLYSFGAVMYVMVTGRPLFTGISTVDVMHKQRFANFDRPRMFALDLPLELDQLICNLLEKRPDKRPPDAYVVLRQLQKLLQLAPAASSASASGGGSMSDATVVDVPDFEEDAFGATFVRDLVRHELTRTQSNGWLPKALDNVWVLTLGFVLLIGGVLWMLFGSSPDPEQLFSRAEAAMQRAPSSEWLTIRDECLMPLLKADRAKWEPTVLPFLQQIELYELESNLAGSRKKGKLRTPQSEPERWLGLARHHLDLGEFEAADRILTALEPLISHEPEGLRTLAARLRTLLDQRRKASSRFEEFLSLQSARAEGLLQAGRTAWAREVWTSIIDLYGRDPAARQWTDLCREQLAKTDGAVDATAPDAATSTDSFRKGASTDSGIDSGSKRENP